MAKKKQGRPARTRSLSEELIDARARHYEELQDPLRVWEAYLLTRRDPWGRPHAAPVPLPEWISGYFDRVAVKLLAVSREEPKGAELVQALLAALEMDGHGRGTVFARRKSLRRVQQYAVDVQTLIQTGQKRYLAYESVARTHKVDPKTVRAAYNQVKARGYFLVPGGWETLPGPSRGIRPR